jgi:PAS domain S-box-containing protein
MLITPSGRISLMNERITSITGYRLEDIEDRNQRLFYPNDDESARVGQMIVEGLSQGNPVEADTTWVRKDGEIHHVHLNLSPIDPDDISAGAICKVTDVTQQKEAEENLLESEERYRAVIEHSDVGAALIQGRLVTYVNRKFLDIFGYDKPEDIIGRPGEEYVYPDDRQMVIENNLKRQGGEDVPERYTFRGVRQNDGAIFFFEVSAARITFGGKPHSIAFFRDITEQKNTEAALRASEDRFRTLIEKSAEIISLTDINRERIYVSPSAKVILGYSVEEYLAMHLNDLCHPDEMQAMEEQYTWIQEHPGEAISYTSRLRHKDSS